MELARPVGDSGINRPWSKYSQGSSAFEKRQPAAPKPVEEEKKAENRETVKKELDRKLRIMAELYGADAAEQLAKEQGKLDEYLEVMQPRSTSRTWANDQIAANPDQKIVGKGPATRKGKPKAEVLAVANRKPGGEGLLVTKSHVTFEDDEDDASDGEYQDVIVKPSSADGADDDQDMEDEELEPDDDTNVAKNPEISDMDYFRARMSKNVDDEDGEDGEEAEPDEESNEDTTENAEVDQAAQELEQIHLKRSGQYVAPEPDSADENQGTEKVRDLLADGDDEQKNVPAKMASKPTDAQNEVPPMELVAETGRLFVRNLAYSCTEDDLKALFSKHGPVAEIHIPIAKDTKQPRGYAFVMYLIPEHAVKAMMALHGSIFQGRIIEVLAGQEKPQPKVDVTDEKSSYKKKLAAKRKETAKTGEAFWNSLFMNSDAVAEAMAKRLGVTKAEVLDPDSENLAVRLALAETHVVNETKAYLEEEGISLDNFEKNLKKERSNTVLLVKNIPFSTVEEELIDAFGKFGSLGRVVLPPARTIALIEFLEPNEAKSAFRNLAFSKFKHLPLYLEWAPVGVFKEGFVKGQAKKATEAEEATAAPAAEDESGPAGSTGATLFVKNLNFGTTDDGLRQAFETIGGLRSATIATKPDPKHKGAKLSMGFGFVEFSRKEDAIQAVKKLQGFVLDGHALQIKFSNRASTAGGADEGAAAASASKNRTKKGEAIEAKGTKLLVRNVPFEATKKDIRQLFSSFGQLKSVRLPKKSQLGGGQYRGFAFVDFLTKQEAKNAFEALANTHLYGRHLVIEWAEDDESVEALRQKTRKHFHDADADAVGNTIGGSKRKKITLDEDEGSDEE